MNSLQDLNYYSNVGIGYSDDRLSSVTFDRTNVTNQSISVNQGAFFNQPVGIELTDMISLPEDITYTINVSTAPGTTVTWTGLGGHLTANIVSPNVYKVWGIRSIEDWALARSPVVDLPNNIIDNFSYQSTITYLGGNTKVWTTGVSIISSNELAPVNNFYYTDGPNLVPTTHIVPLGNVNLIPASYQVTIRSNHNEVFGSFSANGSAGFSSWAGNVLTISGNYQAVNQRLANLTFTPKSGADVSFIANIASYNSITQYTSYRLQSLGSVTAKYLSQATPSTYTKNLAEIVNTDSTPDLLYKNTNFILLDGNILIQPFEYASCRLDVWPDNPASITYISSEYANVAGKTMNNSYTTSVGEYIPNSGTSVYNQTGWSWDNTTKTYTWVAGIRTFPDGSDDFNSVLNDLRIQPGLNYTDPITLNYRYTANKDPIWEANLWVNGNFDTSSIATRNPTGNITVRTQTLYETIPSSLVSNMNITRTFQKNRPDVLFASDIPYINETLPGTYTIYFSSIAGEFGLTDNNTSPNWNYSGSYSQINNIFSQIKFYPYYNVTDNQTFTYSQSYNDNMEVTNQIVNLVGSGNGTLSSTSANVTITSSGIWNPTFEQKYYYKMNIAVIGGGAGGRSSYYDGNGGGGGNVITRSNITLYSDATFNFGSNIAITVGYGGSYNNDGADTIFGNITSAGGKTDGTSGSGRTRGTTSSFGVYYSGGAGAGSNGGNGSPSPYSNGVSLGTGGQGGTGISFTWPGYGTSPNYGAGGGGWAFGVAGPAGSDGGGMGGNGKYGPMSGYPATLYGGGGGGSLNQNLVKGNGFGGHGYQGAVILYFHQ